MIRQKKAVYRRQPETALPGNNATFQPEKRKSVNPPPVMVRIYALLDRHLQDPSVCVNWLAHQLDMNRKTLYRQVYSFSQLTPTGLIRGYRLRKAAELLNAGHPVRETATLTGFKTASHFTTVFKEFYRQTPREFIASQQPIQGS